MAPKSSRPGVYVEEIPTGFRPIAGVPTSITAFIGRAARGPVDEPTLVNSFNGFERIFGGLWDGGTLGFAVRDFFQNGGSQALVVRLQRKAQAARLELPGGLVLEAASPGAWGNALLARVDHEVSESAAATLGLPVEDLYNLTLRDAATGATERFENVTGRKSRNKVGKVLASASHLARAIAPLPQHRPPAHGEPGGGEDPFDAGLCTGADGAGHDGKEPNARSFIRPGHREKHKGLYALDETERFNLLCIPPYLPDGNVDEELVSAAAAYCEERRAMFIADAPTGWTSASLAVQGMQAGVGTHSRNAALYFPRLRQPNPLKNGQPEDFAPCGAVAGVFARSDAQRGVWKAPAGNESTLHGAPGLAVLLSDAEQDTLNPIAVNCLRDLPGHGTLVWGSRTLEGADQAASEWKYVPVRRLALFIEESIEHGIQWAVFEPNAEPLWANVRQSVASFMEQLFRQGAFQGSSAKEAYFVRCDRSTTTQADQDAGVFNLMVGFAPLKPAEFVVLGFRQKTARTGN